MDFMSLCRNWKCNIVRDPLPCDCYLTEQNITLSYLLSIYALYVVFNLGTVDILSTVVVWFILLVVTVKV